ncbi:LLM class flavin-dependent oxidoreductase [Paenibacillus sp. ACRRY]|uniref:LLM class flavin-dependent oxidoreductase n=1 Tax=Paenibacillus sp. ACRRY TaxID=2918208 RepID=UPI001EF687C7|nr:LLM class flavin-dependent oxidoreductase [Paenibacillus sp. ACRRY]MCG7384505.1 LLM class flavin-dependent oxidoreductase [Paenibacillus sp. ACRRY]
MIKRLSILDMAPVDLDSSGQEALMNTIKLAKKAEEFGYFRFWVTEHHNMPSVASASPEILIAQIAANTKHIRVGSGGIMLPNHSPLKVAENFKLLETFNSKRIDLGIGRAAGTDGRTALAIRRSHPNPHGGDNFQELLYELMGYDSTSTQYESHPFPDVVAMPEEVELPPIWILGSSLYSAQLAAKEKLNYVYAYNFNPSGTKESINQYRKRYREMHKKEASGTIVGISVIGAETAKEVQYLKSRLALRYLKGLGLNIETDVKDFEIDQLSNELKYMVNNYLSTIIIGTWSELKQQLDFLADDLQVEELIISSSQEGLGSRVKLYEKLADMYEIKRN